LESLVEAVNLIEDRNFEIRLIGEGRNKNKLINLVNKKGLYDVIKFFDSVRPKELLNYFEESHFLYLSLKKTPLFEKTVPAKFQTYLAVGIPIIGYISGETNDLISKYNLGFTCDSNNVNQLVAILKNISTLKDKDYKEMKVNCKSIYTAEYHSIIRKNDILNLLK
ncbi:MAG: glycosyltransferase, partial [Flavobacteriaceae bacterium]